MTRQNETASPWREAEITDDLQAPQARFNGSRHEQDHWPEREEHDARSYGRYDIDDDEPQNRQPQSHQWRDNQQPEPHWQNDYDNRRYAYSDDARFDHAPNDHRERRQNGPSELDQDLKAMATVWAMMRQGAVRMLGEIGRQY